MDITITLTDNDTGATISRRKFVEDLPEDMNCALLEDMIDSLKDTEEEHNSYQENLTSL